MKKFIAAALLTASLAFILTACGTFTCDLCKKESDGEKFEITIGDKTSYICENCKSLGGLLD